MLWIVGGLLIFCWFVLSFMLGKSGYVHILFFTGLSLLIVEFAAYRKARHQKKVSNSRV